MKKRNLLVLLAACSLMLAGCNQKKEEPKKDDEQQTPSTVAVTSVTVAPGTLALEVGGTGNLTATVAPENATDKAVTWASSNSAVATVANGVVTAVSAGTAEITATAGGKSGKCVVTVTNPAPATVEVTSVTVAPATLALEVGGSGNLTATVAPDNATNKTVTWTTSNAAVATVNNGAVTAVAKGSATITATAGGKSGTCAVTVSEPAPTVNHQDPFVRDVTDPSLTRAYRDEFDEMIEDFSSATPTGETTGAFTGSLLRVLVDSNDTNEPTSPDASIYKMATGVHAIENYEGIGFKIRAVGNKSIKLSNLVLGLRGDDAYKVYPLNLGQALDPDQEELPELTDQFQEIIVSPKQSLDANTKYELAVGGASEQTVLGKILGFHLYALDEECSAVLEIENVFLYEAGEKTVLDNFSREKVNKTDDSCWWRDSTGFIVQKGVTLKNAKYTTKAITLGDYKNVVFNVLGDTSGLKINNVAYASLKDSEGKALTGAVNGAFMSYVVNLEKSGLELAEGKLVFESTTEVVISQIFLSNLINEVPVTEYPKIDIANASYLTKFEATKAAGSIKTNYDDAAADTETNNALGTNYVIAWAGTELVSMDGHNLVLAKDTDAGLVNLVIGSNAEVKDYLVLAIRAEENPASLRFKLGTSEVVNLSSCVAGPGLPTVPTAPGYPYMLEDGFALLVIDLARSGFAGVNNEINIFYNGDTKVEIGSIFFADAYKPAAEVKETVLLDKNMDAGEGYGYVAAVDVTGIKYLKIETTAAAANELRFGLGGDAIYLNTGNLVNIDGEKIAATETEFILDIEASGIVLENGQWFHIHSTLGDAFNIKVSSYELIPVQEITTEKLLDKNMDAGEGYGYVAAVDVTGIKYLLIKTTAVAANELRFGLGGDAIYLNTGNLVNIDGEKIAATETEFILDIEASGIVLENNQWFHIHSTLGEAFNIKVYSYSVKPTLSVKELAGGLDKNMDAGEGYGYVAAVDVSAANAVKVVTTAAAANELRFGLGGDAIYLNTGNLVDINGEKVPATATEFTIDLAASGIVLENNQWFHIHSTLGDAFNIKVTPILALEVGSYAYLLAAYAG